MIRQYAGRGSDAYHPLTLTGIDPGLLIEIDPLTLADCAGLAVFAGISKAVVPG